MGEGETPDASNLRQYANPDGGMDANPGGTDAAILKPQPATGVLDSGLRRNDGEGGYGGEGSGMTVRAAE